MSYQKYTTRLYYFLLIICILATGGGLAKSNFFNCKLPQNCQIDLANVCRNLLGNDNKYEKVTGIVCDITSSMNFTFRVDGYTPLLPHRGRMCEIDIKSVYEIIEFRWPRQGADTTRLLNQAFNITAFFSYLNYFYRYVNLHLVNLGGFEIELADDSNTIDSSNRSVIENSGVADILVVNSVLAFYTRDGRRVKTCADLANTTHLTSLFQIQMTLAAYTEKDFQVFLINCAYPERLCPRLFTNALINRLYLVGLIDSFYSRRLLSFDQVNYNQNETRSSLNSTIFEVFLSKVHNVKLDDKLLNPHVFSKIKVIIYSRLKDHNKTNIKIFL